MKILTKKWAVQYEQIKFIYRLKEFDSKKQNYNEICKKSKEDYLFSVESDKELKNVVSGTCLIEELYKAQIERNKNVLYSLPQKVIENLTDANSIILGYANKKDKDFLTSYGARLIKENERLSHKANKITETAQDFLPEEFVLDDCVGEIVLNEYVRGNDYYINVDGKIICVENYEILERDNFKINLWQEDNPLSLWTALIAGELHFVKEDCYELHLLLIDGDKYENIKYWYFTLKGTNVKMI